MLAGTVVSAVAVVAVATAVTLPWPTRADEPLSIAVDPAPAESVAVCDGGLLSIGRDAMAAGSLTAASPEDVTSGVTQGAPAPQQQTLSVANVAGSPGTLAFTAAPVDRTRVDVGAAGSSEIAAEDLAGYAASACRPPLMESWLVGGSAATGAADLVLLSNPGTVPATVQLTVYGSAGVQTPPGGDGVIIAPGTQRILPLAGLALGEASPVLRVSATGAPVHASLQTSLTRTLTPGGVDHVAPVAEPRPQQTITGVTVTATPGTAGASDAATLLRVLSPSADASATLTVTASGLSVPAIGPQSVTLVAGQPAEVDLGGLPIGSYTVQVDADSPVLAAVWQTTGFGEGDDFAWYTPSPDVTVPTLFATPSGPAPVMTLVNDADEPAPIAITSDDGSYRLELTVPAKGAMTARLSPREVYLLEPGSTGIQAGISLAAEGALAGISVWPADAAAPQITVYP
jgi:hypothetical protein